MVKNVGNPKHKCAYEQILKISSLISVNGCEAFISMNEDGTISVLIGVLEILSQKGDQPGARGLFCLKAQNAAKKSFM